MEIPLFTSPANRNQSIGGSGLANGDVENRLRELPEDLRRQVLDYMEFLLSKHKANKRRTRKFKFDWEGGLAELADRYTAVELQHKASE